MKKWDVYYFKLILSTSHIWDTLPGQCTWTEVPPPHWCDHSGALPAYLAMSLSMGVQLFLFITMNSAVTNVFIHLSLCSDAVTLLRWIPKEGFVNQRGTVF